MYQLGNIEPCSDKYVFKITPEQVLVLSTSDDCFILQILFNFWVTNLEDSPDIDQNPDNNNLNKVFSYVCVYKLCFQESFEQLGGLGLSSRFFKI